MEGDTPLAERGAAVGGEGAAAARRLRPPGGVLVNDAGSGVPPRWPSACATPSLARVKAWAWLVVVLHGAGAAWRGDRLREPGAWHRVHASLPRAPQTRTTDPLPPAQATRSPAPGTARSQPPWLSRYSPRCPAQRSHPSRSADGRLVDDELAVRALAWLLRSRRLLSEGFAHADAFETWLAGRMSPAPGRWPVACCWTCACRAPAWCDRARPDRAHAGDLPHRPRRPTAVAAVNAVPSRLRQPFSDNAWSTASSRRWLTSADAHSGARRPGGAGAGAVELTELTR